MPKIILISPYLKTLGGGERYLLSIGEVLSRDYQIFITAGQTDINKARQFFGLSLTNFQTIDPDYFSKLNFFNRYKFLNQYRAVFYMTDGSLFSSPLKKSFLIIQSPAHLPHLNLTNSLKFKNWQIICYSSFMQKIIRERIAKIAEPLPPYINLSKVPAAKIAKKNIILSVGRFFSSHLHEKRQDFLLDFFLKNYERYFKDWQLILSGNLSEQSGEKYVASLKKSAEGFPIKILTAVSFNKLSEFYKSAKIYWHAAGYGSDQIKNPEKLEHFGITTLEAMAYGSVPLVFAGGGQLDIIRNNLNGLLWHNEASFLKANLEIIKNEKKRLRMSKLAIKRAADFSRDSFEKKLNEIFKK